MHRGYTQPVDFVLSASSMPDKKSSGQHDKKFFPGRPELAVSFFFLTEIPLPVIKFMIFFIFVLNIFFILCIFTIIHEIKKFHVIHAQIIGEMRTAL